MASLVHLVRHGEVDNPDHVVYAKLAGFGLTENGRAQAAKTARHLGSQAVVAVWSSPLERALETASAIARRFGIAVMVDEALTEWGLADRWAGKRWDDLPQTNPGELESYLESPLDLPFASESLPELATRMRTAIEAISAAHPQGDVVIVSHQDPVQAARLSFAGRSLATLNQDKPGHCSVITLRPSDGWRELGMWTPDG